MRASFDPLMSRWNIPSMPAFSRSQITEIFQKRKETFLENWPITGISSYVNKKLANWFPVFLVPLTKTPLPVKAFPLEEKTFPVLISEDKSEISTVDPSVSFLPLQKSEEKALDAKVSNSTQNVAANPERKVEASSPVNTFSDSMDKASNLEVNTQKAGSSIPADDGQVIASALAVNKTVIDSRLIEPSQAPKPSELLVEKPVLKTPHFSESSQKLYTVAKNVFYSAQSGLLTGATLWGAFIAVPFICSHISPPYSNLNYTIQEITHKFAWPVLLSSMGIAVGKAVMTYSSLSQNRSTTVSRTPSSFYSKIFQSLKAGWICQAQFAGLTLPWAGIVFDDRDALNKMVTIGLGLSFYVGFGRKYVSLSLEEKKKTEMPLIKDMPKQPTVEVKKTQFSVGLWQLLCCGFIGASVMSNVSSLKRAFHDVKDTFDELQKHTMEIAENVYELAKEKFYALNHTQMAEVKPYKQWLDWEFGQKALIREKFPGQYLQEVYQSVENLSEQEISEKFKCADILATTLINPEEIKSHRKIFRELSLIAHPDKSKKSQVLQNLLNRAYSEMKEEKKCTSAALEVGDDMDLEEEIQKTLVVPSWLSTFLFGEKASCSYDLPYVSIEQPLQMCSDLISQLSGVSERNYLKAQLAYQL